MGIKADEKSSLLKRILASPGFKNAPDQQKILTTLAAREGKKTLARDLEEIAMGRPPNHPDHNPGRMRIALIDTKAKLEAFAQNARKDPKAREKWKCVLPDGDEDARLGFHLRYIRAEETGPIRFWEAHLDSAEESLLVNGSHLFLYSTAERKILRLADFNASGRKDQILEKFAAKYPLTPLEGFEPWCDMYLATGEVRAHEHLLEYFHQKAGILLRRVNSRDVSEEAFLRSTPILVGRLATNSFICDNFNTRAGEHLDFRFDDKGVLRIRGIDEHGDRERLADFRVGKDSTISSPHGEKHAFGIFARIRNWTGYGHVTMILCDSYAMVIARIIEATLEEKQAARLLEKMGRSLSDELPDSFEMLFSVELSPGGRPGEGMPKLLTWRLHESETLADAG